MNKIKLIECPRDAMQGWKHFIPTQQKIEYLNQLLQVGFDTLDFGSFVSPKAIPQMADTKEVIKSLDISKTSTKLLAIVANLRGAKEAIVYNEIDYLGFPFSISPTFQLRNTNSTQEESLKIVEVIQSLCLENDKKLVVYLSMGFGNPYGDVYNEDVLHFWASKIIDLGVQFISLADTVGVANENQITKALQVLIPTYNNVEFGVHLHSSSTNWELKFKAALESGCKRFDGAIKGIGGCPMAQDSLVGNMDTLNMVDYAAKFFPASINLNKTELEKASKMADTIFI